MYRGSLTYVPKPQERSSDNLGLASTALQLQPLSPLPLNTVMLPRLPLLVIELAIRLQLSEDAPGVPEQRVARLFMLIVLRPLLLPVL